MSIADNVAKVRERIASACARAGRDPLGVRLVAVSKFHPTESILEGIRAGLRDFGESRPQELHRKWREVKSTPSADAVCWHMIGSVQRNKAKLVAEAADVLHSVDSLRLAEAISSRLEGADARGGRALQCLVQVNISSESSKGGVAPQEAADLVRAISGLPGLTVVGLMGMAEMADEPEVVRPQFRLLRETASHIAGLGLDNVSMQQLSMGMSHDLEIAVEEGATMVRVGTAIFGERPA